MGIVEEFEKTISQLISEKERESVCNVIARERLQTERAQILEDLQAVERAFNDLHRRYERLKEHAETKLSEASSRMEEVTKTKGVEIARLTVQLRKAEMMVTSLERQVDQKTRENQELTT